MVTVLGLIGYVLLIAAAGLVDIRLALVVAGVECLYLAYANEKPQPPRRA